MCGLSISINNVKSYLSKEIIHSLLSSTFILFLQWRDLLRRVLHNKIDSTFILCSARLSFVDLSNLWIITKDLRYHYFNIELNSLTPERYNKLVE